MANVAVPGFIPIVKGGLTTELVRKRVLTNNTTAIFKGDSCVITGSGDVVVQSTGTTTASTVARGASYLDSTGQRVERAYLPATTTYTSTTVDPYNASYAYCVKDMVNTGLRASVDAAIALTDLNLNYAVTLGTGSTTSGMSAHELTATGRAGTATIPYRVTEFILGDPLSDPDSAHAHVICYLNAGAIEPALSAGSGT